MTHSDTPHVPAGRKLRAGAWCRSPALEQSLRAAAASIELLELNAVPRAARAPASAAAWADDCEALIVEVDLADPDEFVLLERLIEMRGPRRPVIATAPNAAVDSVRRMMRLGVGDFLPQPISRADLEHSLSGVAGRAIAGDNTPKRGAVASFMRASGGAGATTLAIHTAVALAQRTPQQKVALVDLDLQRGAVALNLDVSADVGVVHCLERYREIDPGLVHSVASKHASGIEVFATAVNRWPLDDYAPEAVARLIETMRRGYDWVIIDTPPVWTRWHRALLEHTDIAAVVLQKTVVQLRAARELVAALHETLHAEQIVTVCNRTQAGWFSRDIPANDAERGLGRGLDFAIPSDYALVSEAANLGVPASKIRAGSKFEKAVAAMAEDIDRRTARRRLQAAAAPAHEDKNTSSRGWNDEIRRVAG